MKINKKAPEEGAFKLTRGSKVFKGPFDE